MSHFHVIIALALIFLACHTEAKRNFRAGRYRGHGLVPPPLSGSDDVASTLGENQTIFWITQPLDHFNKSIDQPWKQRYQVNADYYQAGGPFFVMISGEAKLAEKWLYSGQMFKNGKKHGALMFQLEHRFYGLSQPTSDVTVENLRYLSSLQALADLDAFINSMKESYNRTDANVVVFGGSYSGNLVVWYRALYPNTTIGGVASSAPVLAEVDFVEYMETVGSATRYFNQDCYEAISDAFTQIQSLVTAQNDAELNRLFGLCQGKINYSDPYQLQAFYDALGEDWMGAVQYNSAGNDSKVANYCRIMTDVDLGTPLDRYSVWFKNSALDNDTTCIDVDYNNEINALSNTSWDAPEVADGSRPWLWQTCTEFGYYQTRDSKKQPFGFKTVDIDYIEYTQCLKPFGITSADIAKSVELTNMKYGAKKPNATKLFLFNGSIDPWHPLAIYDHDLNAESPSRYITGTSHCYDMHDDRPDDPPELTRARDEMAQTLSKWLEAATPVTTTAHADTTPIATTTPASSNMVTGSFSLVVSVSLALLFRLRQ